MMGAFLTFWGREDGEAHPRDGLDSLWLMMIWL